MANARTRKVTTAQDAQNAVSNVRSTISLLAPKDGRGRKQGEVSKSILAYRAMLDNAYTEAPELEGATNTVAVAIPLVKANGEPYEVASAKVQVRNWAEATGRQFAKVALPTGQVRDDGSPVTRTINGFIETEPGTLMALMVV